jgi:hypothetical protein
VAVEGATAAGVLAPAGRAPSQVCSAQGHEYRRQPMSLCGMLNLAITHGRWPVAELRLS